MNSRSKRVFRTLIICIAMLFLSCIVLETIAHARAGGGRSSGSRGFSSGSRSSGSTYNRSTTTSPARPTQQPGTNPSGAGRSFLYGLGGGLMGGMIGSMLFGRSGYAGNGMGGGGFGFGDIIILLIIAGIIYFVYKRYKAKKEMQMSTASPAGYGAYSYNEPAYEQPSYAGQQAGDPVADGLRHIGEMDPSFNEQAFNEKAEDLFFKIQGGWTRRDISGLSDLLTPQMRDTFQADINRYLADKKINRLENIAVRQVEIVDAVQDQGEEYITVRFTASLLDFVTDESGSVLSGSSNDPVKFLEYWTFTRRVGDRNWRLSGITQEQDYR